ncbi:MAG: ABC transporter substrate-binding protein, partial [Paludibacteraceae bacterium]
MRFNKHNKYNKWVLSVIITMISFMLVFLSGCGSQTPSSQGGGDAKEIKIGVILPLTGALAKIGENNKNGYELAVNDVNKNGGIKALGGAKLKLVYGDSQGKPDVGVSETERLIQNEQVVVVTGAFQSNVTIPTTQVAERLRTPYLNPVAIADSITDRGFKYTFQINAKGSGFARDQVNFLDYVTKLTNKKPQKVALLYENTDFGQSTSAGQKKYLAEKGYDIVADVSYPAGAADVTIELSKIKASNPDVVLQVSYIADAILIAKTKDRLGIKVPFVDSAGGAADPAFIQTVKELANGWFTINQFNKDLPGSKELNDRFKV